MNEKIILILILLFAFFLRVVNIQNVPPALYGDELTIALDANSLLHSGSDQLGNVMPLTFAMGAGRPAGYVYGSIPFIAVFGPTELGVRMLSILSGLGIVFLLFLLAKKLFSKEVGIIAALIASVSPWDISLSRGGFEAHFALGLSLLGIYLLILAKQKAQFYILSTLAFGLAIHTYPTYKLALPMIIPLILYLFGWFKNIQSAKDKFYLTVAVFIFGFFGILSVIQTVSGGSETRFSTINIFSQDRINQQIEQKINLERSITNLPSNIAKYFHNKPTEYAKIFIENYLQNFSVDFLVIHGDRNPRHNMATMGQIYFVEFILFFVGLLSFWQKKRKILIALLIWLILAPIPTAIVDLPHALRSSFMLPPIIIISSLGFFTIFKQKNKVFLVIFTLMLLVQFFFFTQKLYFLAPAEYSHFWSYAAKLASEKALQNKNGFDFIILSDRIDAIEFAYPVYAKIKPFEIIEQNKKKTEINGYSFKKFDNVYVGNIPEANVQNFIEGLKVKVLYIDLPSSAHLLKNYEILEGLDKKEILVLEKI